MIFQNFDLKISTKFDKFIKVFWKLNFQVPTTSLRRPISIYWLQVSLIFFEYKKFFLDFYVFFINCGLFRLFWRNPSFFTQIVSVLQFFCDARLCCPDDHVRMFQSPNLHVKMMTKTTSLTFLGWESDSLQVFTSPVVVIPPDFFTRWTKISALVALIIKRNDKLIISKTS